MSAVRIVNVNHLGVSAAECKVHKQSKVLSLKPKFDVRRNVEVAQFQVIGCWAAEWCVLWWSIAVCLG
jgi:hypothetical protein